MKLVLGLATLALAALAIEERARQVAQDAQHAYGEAAGQARDAAKTLSRNVEQRPLVAILIAVGVGYGLAVLLPHR